MIAIETATQATSRRLEAWAIDVCVVPLDRLRTPVSAFVGMLSPDERERAERFVFERDRRRFAACRGALRVALGEYLGLDPAAVSFAYGRRGKPFLPGRELSFNVSHTDGLALFAFSRTDWIGVDVESLSRQVDAEALAQRFFCPDEVRDLVSVAAHERVEAFFNGWTRKESYIKAIGDGLSCPLDSFSVTLRPGDPAAIRWIDGDDASRWGMAAFKPIEGFVAAVTSPLASARVRVRFWGDDGTAPVWGMQDGRS